MNKQTLQLGKAGRLENVIARVLANYKGVSALAESVEEHRTCWINKGRAEACAAPGERRFSGDGRSEAQKRRRARRTEMKGMDEAGADAREDAGGEEMG
jgi:hypothetical protein